MPHNFQTQLSNWFLACRPKTLPAAVAPVIIGGALAIHYNSFQAFPFFAALFGSLMLQIAVNLANDYFDGVKGIDNEDRLGPVRVTQQGLISPPKIKRAISIIFVLIGLDGIYLITIGGLPILIVGILSMISALAYSGGPYPLASNGLGDLFVFVFFGPVAVCGTFYVQTKIFLMDIFVSSLPIGLLICAILVVNNLRDMATDAKVNKNTLATIIGQKNTILEYRVLLVLAYLIPLWQWLCGFKSFWVFIIFFASPLAIFLWRDIFEKSGSQLNETLARTAQHALLFSAFYAIGLVAS